MFSTIANKAAPYLFPSQIEFSLIAAAVVYKIYSNVGADIHPATMACRIQHKVEKIVHNECDKANTGLFLGLTVFIITAIATCVLLVYTEHEDHINIDITPGIFAYTDITVNSISFIATILAFVRMRKLHFMDHLESKFDQNLVLLGLGGYYMLIGLGIVGAAPHFVHSYFARLHIAGKVINFIQATVQVVFIIDGLRRCAFTSDQFTTKPGRSLITFLLICNLSMWLINTFLMKNMTGAKLLREFYGPLPWVIMVHMTLPLAIFFRFHSSICLSDIWLVAYKKDSDTHNHFICKQSTANNLL